VRPFRLFAAASLLLTSWSGSAQAVDKSIRGLKAGMTVTEALQSLSGDLRKGAKVSSILEDPVTAILAKEHPGDPLYKTFMLTSGDREACDWSDTTRERGACLALRAAVSAAPKSGGRLYNILLSQFFEEPPDFSAFTQRVKEAYGNPVVSIGPTGGKDKEGHGLVNWLWSDESLAQTPEVRKWVEKGFPAGIVDVQFAAPVLHMQVYVRRGQVRGMQVILFEPSLLREFRSALDDWSKRKAQEGAGRVQLR
jgi:hypothetical protein